jgi:nitroimidazol reductase NimA-like FMN-containing flavoprotein (pyridoxamine 5'-phosphate oxidase superfamily)
MSSRGLETLSDTECRALLASASVGRVGVRIADAPAILPVNFALLDGEVVFRTAPGSKLAAALMGVQMAFEVDDAVGPGAGWSVLVVGYAEQIRDTATLERVDRLGLEPWVDEHDHFVVRIKARRVTGRRILPLRSRD